MRHLNTSKFNLDKKGTKTSSNGFAKFNLINLKFVLHILASVYRNNSNTNDYDENKAKLKVGKISASNLNAVRKRNINRLIIEQLNINSLWNKFESFAQQVTGNIDTLMVWQTKLDKMFPVSQFLIDNYGPPFRVDLNNNGGGIILFGRDDIPCCL